MLELYIDKRNLSSPPDPDPDLDPDPESAAWLGQLFLAYAVIGIPANLLQCIMTITTESLRAIPMNICIFGIAFADLMSLVFLQSAIIWAQTYNRMVCKVMGVGLYIFEMMTVTLPSCLAICRYAAICGEHELNRKLIDLKTTKGILILNAIFWIYGLTYTLPLVVADKFGLDALGCCGIEKDINSIAFLIYYFVVLIVAVSFSYIIMFIFYRRLSQWTKAITSMMTISAQTRDSLIATRNLMRMLKWLLFIPFVVYFPAVGMEAVVRIAPDAISLRTARYILITLPLSHVLDPIATFIFVKCYRTALYKLLRRIFGGFFPNRIRTIRLASVSNEDNIRMKASEERRTNHS